jgi:hypothetical protein
MITALEMAVVLKMVAVSEVSKDAVAGERLFVRGMVPC